MTDDNRPARGLGIYEITDYEIARLLRLPPGQHVASVSSNWERLTLMIMVEGPGLPAVTPGAHPAVLNQWGRFRTLTPIDVSDLSPEAAHATVLAELGAVRFEDPAALAGRLRILERHAPTEGAIRGAGDFSDARCGEIHDIETSVPWPCDDYRDAAAGLITGLAGETERSALTAARSPLGALGQCDHRPDATNYTPADTCPTCPGIDRATAAVHALIGDPA